MKKYVEHRPWGNFQQFCTNEKITVKILTINQNEQISLQYHNNRDEFWKIMKGVAILVIGDEIIEANEGDEFFIPRRMKHRIMTKDQPVTILEIDFGEFDENDIIRLKDKYNRIK